MLFISYSEIKKINKELKEENQSLQKDIERVTGENITAQLLIQTLTNRYLAAMKYIDMAEHILEENGLPFYYIYEEE